MISRITITTTTMAYHTKRPLIATLVFVGLLKLLILVASIHHSIKSPSTEMTIIVAVSGFYFAVQLSGLISAIRERTCGLKFFSVVQTALVVLSLVGFAFFLWNFSHMLRTQNNDMDGKPLTLSEYNGQDVLGETTTKTNTVPSVEAPKKACRYLPFVVVGLSILITALDLVSALLARRGYLQLVAADAAISTFAYLSEDNEIPMSAPPQPQPLNVVYIPANSMY